MANNYIAEGSNNDHQKSNHDINSIEQEGGEEDTESEYLHKVEPPSNKHVYFIGTTEPITSGFPFIDLW